MALEANVATAYVDVKVNTAQVNSGFKNLENTLKGNGKRLEQNYTRNFIAITNQAKKLGQNISRALNVAFIPMLGFGGKAIHAMLKDTSDATLEARVRWANLSAQINKSMASIGVKIMGSKVWGKTLWEWLDTFSAKLKNVTSDQVQKFVDAIKGIAVTLGVIKATMMGLNFSQIFVKTLSLLGALQGVGAGAGGALGAGLGGALGTGIGKAIPKHGSYEARMDAMEASYIKSRVIAGFGPPVRAGIEEKAAYDLAKITAGVKVVQLGFIKLTGIISLMAASIPAQLAAWNKLSEGFKPILKELGIKIPMPDFKVIFAGIRNFFKEWIKLNRELSPEVLFANTTGTELNPEAVDRANKQKEFNDNMKALYMGYKGQGLTDYFDSFKDKPEEFKLRNEAFNRQNPYIAMRSQQDKSMAFRTAPDPELAAINKEKRDTEKARADEAFDAMIKDRIDNEHAYNMAVKKLTKDRTDIDKEYALKVKDISKDMAKAKEKRDEPLGFSGTYVSGREGVKLAQSVQGDWIKKQAEYSKEIQDINEKSFEELQKTNDLQGKVLTVLEYIKAAFEKGQSVDDSLDFVLNN